MADYYYSVSGSNTTGDGSIGNPWHNFRNTKSSNNALNPGDNCYFKCGDVWTGSSAEIVVRSNGSGYIATSGGATYPIAISPITLNTYGTGSKPKFCSAVYMTSGWVATGISSIYVLTNQTQTHLKVVTQGSDRGLVKWHSTTSTLAEGSFIRSGNSLYVHCWDDANPATSEVRVANYAHSSSADGARGLISTDRTSGSNKGDYVHFKALDVECANGNGVSSSSTGVEFYAMKVMGCGEDGIRMYSELTGSGENAEYSRSFDCDISYCAANTPSSAGQGWTSYAPYTWAVRCESHHNWMAGFDWLDFNANSNVIESGAVDCISHDNGLWYSGSSFDPEFYNDGGRKIYWLNCIAYNAGVNTSTNAREGFKIGSEHSSKKLCNSTYIVNCFGFNCHWRGFNTDIVPEGLTADATSDTFTEVGHDMSNGEKVYFTASTMPSGLSSNTAYYVIGSSSNTFQVSTTLGGSPVNFTTNGSGVNYYQKNIFDIFVINSTFISKNSGAFEQLLAFSDVDPDIADTITMKNNIFVYRSGTSNMGSLGSETNTNLDSDYNLFYRVSGTTLFTVGGTNQSFSGWQGLGHDANGVNADPRFVNMSEDYSTIDLRLQRIEEGYSFDSPAIGVAVANPFTPPSWLPPDIFPYGGVVRGTTRSDNAFDTSVVDLGYHYNSDQPAPIPVSAHVSVSTIGQKISIAGNIKINLVITQ